MQLWLPAWHTERTHLLSLPLINVGSSTHKDSLLCRQDPSSMQAAVDANVAYQARNDPEYQQLVAQQQEMRGPGALSALQVGHVSMSRPLCLHVVPVGGEQEVRRGRDAGAVHSGCMPHAECRCGSLCLLSPVCTV